jgi:predicted SnoaL-like aldol condensation-catalyzing enzyme
LSDEQGRKKIVTDFLQLAIAGKAKDGIRFFAVDCKHHNPFFPAGMGALTAAMAGAAEQPSGGTLTVEHLLADGDLIAAHTALRNMTGEAVFAQVHLFRFSGDKIVEYWDITQPVPANSPNSDGMF